MKDFKNKVVAITGAGSGMGRAYAIEFGKLGAQLALMDWNEANLFETKQLVQDLGVKQVFTKAFDVSIEAEVFKFAEEVKAALGNTHIIINNAGIAGPSFKTWEYPIDQWQNVIDIDLTGLFYCCKSVVPHMIKANYGRIVNIASIAGKEGNPNAMPYSAAKAGVIALTKSLGKELADKNIAVNCVTPAAAKTRIFDQISQEHIDYMLSKIPRGRFIKVDELASMVSWLVSEENSYTTGAVFDLSGGRATY